MTQAITLKLAEYEKVERSFLQEKIKGYKALVETRIIRANESSSIAYTMVKSGGRWLIFDVNVNGVSMIRNMMVQIRSKLRDGSYEAVIELLQENTKQHN